MPLNTNFSDALDRTLPPIPRVWFDRPPTLTAIDAFVQNLLQALQQQVELVYLASIRIDDRDREAAQRIAWLRSNTYSLGAVATDKHIVGALGEWAVLREIGMSQAVTAVSLVSLRPVPEPDFLVQDTNSVTGQTITIPFDIKTTASLNYPAFYYDPVKHSAKGDPHILGLRLSGTWQKAVSADIYLTNASWLFTGAHYTQHGGHSGRPSPSGSLRGNLK